MTLFDPDLTIDDTKDYTNELVGPDKPYKTMADLARATLHKEMHIKRLENETAGMREQIGVLSDDLKARQRLEEMLTKLQPAQPDASRNNEPPAREPDTQEPDFDSLIETKLAEREKQTARNRNLDTVKSRLTQEYGANTANVLTKAAESLGMSKDELTEAAARNPKAFYRLIGIDETPNPRQPSTPPQGVNTAGFRPAATNTRGASYYEALKRDNPKTYWLPATQLQMHEDAHQMGYDVFKTK